MTVGQSKWFMAIFAVMALLVLLRIWTSDSTGLDWAMVAISLTNVFIGYINFKKAKRNV